MGPLMAAPAPGKANQRELGLQVTKEVFAAAKGRLKVVGRAGVGVDNVDLQAATEVVFAATA